MMENGKILNRGRLIRLGKLEKREIRMNRENVYRAIVNLRMDITAYREARMYGKVAEARLEIARLEAILRNMKEIVLTT